jgi:hypothetical protein
VKNKIYTIEYQGKVFDLEAPEGTSPQQLQAAVMAQYKPSESPQGAPVGGSTTQPPQGVPEGSASAHRWGGGRVGRFVAGLGDSGIKAAIGMKRLVGMGSEDDQRVLDMMKQDQEQDGAGWRTGGQVLGDIAQFAVPGAKVAKYAEKATRALPNALSKLAPVVGAGAASGAQEFLTNTDENLSDRVANTGKAVALGGGVAAGGKVLKKAVTQPFRPSAEAERLMAEGIVPKLQEGAEGKFGRFVGRLAQGSVDPYNSREQEETIRAIAKRMLPNEDVSNLTAPELTQALERKFHQGYSNALGGKLFTLTSTMSDSITKAGRRVAGQGQQGARDIYEKEIANLLPAQGHNPRNVRWFKEQDRGLSAVIGKFDERIGALRRGAENVDNMRAARALEAAKDRYVRLVRDKQLTADELKEVQGLSKDWAGFRPLRESLNSAAGQQRMRVGAVIDASQKGTNIARGQYANSDILEPANRIFAKDPDTSRSLLVNLNRSLGPLGVAGAGVALGGGATLATGSPLAAAILGPMYATALAGQTRSGAKALMGDTKLQKKLAELMRKTPVPYNIGAVPDYTQEEE